MTKKIMITKRQNIKFLDLSPSEKEMLEYTEAFDGILRSGQFINGSWNKKFAEVFSDQVGAKHCVGVGNGYDALRLALRSLSLNEDDEIIVPAHTFIATWNSVEEVGAKIIPVDVCRNNYLIDLELVRDKITAKTKAIICVHLYGLKCNLDELYKISKERDIFIIEDCAQSHGTLIPKHIKNEPKRITCWSFYPGKTIGAFGDAGAVCMNDKNIFTRISSDQNYGSQLKYKHNHVGINSRLDEIQAMVLCHKLKSSQDEYERRKFIKTEYISRIKNKHIFISDAFSIYRSSTFNGY